MPHWVRVRDKQTGHTFDIEANVLPHRRGVDPVDDPDRWPDLVGPQARPRPAKPYVRKDGRAKEASGGETPAGSTGQPDATGDGGTVDQPQTGPEQGSGRRRTSRTTSTPPDAPADTEGR